MKSRLLISLAALSSGCTPSSRTAPPIAGASTVLATVTRVEIGDVRHPYLRWTVTVKVDKVISGPSPGEEFRLAIHSPSQEGIKVDHRYRITARKKDGGYELIACQRRG